MALGYKSKPVTYTLRPFSNPHTPLVVSPHFVLWHVIILHKSKCCFDLEEVCGRHAVLIDWCFKYECINESTQTRMLIKQTFVFDINYVIENPNELCERMKTQIIDTFGINR